MPLVMVLLAGAAGAAVAADRSGVIPSELMAYGCDQCADAAFCFQHGEGCDAERGFFIFGDSCAGAVPCGDCFPHSACHWLSSYSDDGGATTYDDDHDDHSDHWHAPMPSYEGHDPSKCLEEHWGYGHSFDDDCCAVDGAASCADGYILEWNGDSCDPGSFHYPLRYSCVPPGEPHDAFDPSATFYPCDQPDANCQCTKGKSDAGECGGPPGCYRADSRRDCERHDDKWLGHCDGICPFGTQLTENNNDNWWHTELGTYNCRGTNTYAADYTVDGRTMAADGFQHYADDMHWYFGDRYSQEGSCDAMQSFFGNPENSDCCVPVPCPYGTCSMKRSQCGHQLMNAPKGEARKEAICVEDGPCHVLYECLEVLMQYPSCHETPAVKQAYEFASTTAQLCDDNSTHATQSCEDHANVKADRRCPAGPELAAIEQAKRSQRPNDLGFQNRRDIKSRLTTELHVEFEGGATEYTICDGTYHKDAYFVKVDPLDPKGTEVTPWQARDRGAFMRMSDYTPDIYWEPKPNKTYTLLMVDATASPATQGLWPGPLMLHSMFTNCRGSIKSCDALMPYMGPGVPVEEPQFNYIWLLYEGSVDPTPEQMGDGTYGYSAIAGFDANQFAEDHGLGRAVGMNWFYSKRDETIPFIWNVLWNEVLGTEPCPADSPGGIHAAQMQAIEEAKMEQRAHDPSKCLEDHGYGLFFDDDCCAVDGSASCADGHILEWNGDSCCPDCPHNPLRYSCVPPGISNRRSINTELDYFLDVKYYDEATDYTVCGRTFPKKGYHVVLDPLNPKGTDVTPWQARDRGASQLSADKTDYTPDIYWAPKPNKTYTLLMVDATAASALDFPGPFMLHSMFTNCRGSIKSCDALIPYMGPGVLEPINQYNYIWLLYEGSVDPTPEQMGNGFQGPMGTGYSNILGFDVNQFAEDHGLGPAVGMNWFYSKRDSARWFIYNKLWNEGLGRLPCPGEV
jgi:hypothetical protein